MVWVGQELKTEAETLGLATRHFGLNSGVRKGQAAGLNIKNQDLFQIENHVQKWGGGWVLGVLLKRWDHFITHSPTHRASTGDGTCPQCQGLRVGAGAARFQKAWSELWTESQK